ncbi:CobW family GTP-binding protein [Methylophilus luteus]|uniref:CobW family GTP-binding protein n=1 Tax=Methylophilus luteus TaxID=640108 RepID=A0ABW3F3B9_9PROT
MDKRIPVTLLTGFLGSGKTTLLNKLLHNPAMKDTAVIINELGEAGLDQIFANSQISQTVESEHVADNTVLLSSGCLCCSLKNELADTMRDLFFKRSLQAVPEFNRLVIETTGMADPGPILANLMNEPVIESVYRLDAVVVTIDAAYGLQQIATQKEALKQAAVADVLLITKSDTATPEQISALQSRLAAINPNATQQFVLHGEIDPMQIIDVGLFDFANKQANPERWLRAPASGFSTAKKGTLPQAPAHDDVTTFTVYLPKPMAWADFRGVILKLCQVHGEQLLRLKGILHVEDAPAPLAVHAVHFTPYPPTLLEGWDEEEPISRIVIIGKGIDEAAIREMLVQF